MADKPASSSSSVSEPARTEWWKEEDLAQLPWYHPGISRHVAEVMLRDNGVNGSYLLRKSSSNSGYVVSVRGQSSVQHFEVTLNKDGASYHFGTRNFEKVDEFVEHVRAKPAITGLAGYVTVLEKPYARSDKSETSFAKITKPIGGDAHRFMQTKEAPEQPHRPLSYGAREGYLTKRGRVVKNLKERFFVVDTTTFSYFKNKQTAQPIRQLPLNICAGVVTDVDDISDQQLHGFGLEFPKRTFQLYARSKQDRNAWIEFLKWAVATSKSKGDTHTGSTDKAVDECETAAEDADDRASD